VVRLVSLSGEERKALAQKARDLIERNQGVPRSVSMPLPICWGAPRDIAKGPVRGRRSAGRGPEHGASLLRGVLTPMAWLHQLGLETYLLPYRTGFRKRFRLVGADGLPVPVVAIGNLSSGGTGKTPMAHLVAAYLQRAGHRVVLLSRGHGGSGESGRTPRIVSDGQQVLLGPHAAGDEPVLLAQSLPGVPVVVGRDRRVSGRLAVEKFTPEVIVLDDALQYWQLHRDLDIVLLDARRPFDNGFVLPRGLLREPPSHLKRAGIVVLTRADRAAPDLLARHVEQIRRLAPNADVFTATHAPLGWVRASDGALLPLGALAGESALAFSGIADGKAFAETVGMLGVSVESPRDFGDHYAYRAEDVAAVAQISQGQTVVTTEKDLVKVAPLWPAGASPLYALRIGMALSDEPAFFTRLEKLLTRKESNTCPNP
jgi:tetraacyldisaccharide 4'-kinase